MQTEDQPAGLPAFVRDPMGMVRRRWVWMLVTASIGVIATILYVTTIPITYLARTTVLVTSQQIPERFVASTVTEDALDRINALIGELLSRGRLISIMEKHDPYPRLREERGEVGVVDDGGVGALESGGRRREGRATLGH